MALLSIFDYHWFDQQASNWWAMVVVWFAMVVVECSSSSSSSINFFITCLAGKIKVYHPNQVYILLVLLWDSSALSNSLVLPLLLSSGASAADANATKGSLFCSGWRISFKPTTGLARIRLTSVGGQRWRRVAGWGHRQWSGESCARWRQLGRFYRLR